MPKAALDDLLLCLHRIGAEGAKDLSDGDLLARFLADRNDPAFAVLVKRHGPMVLGLCYRILADMHAAEDCFQATFMVLVRRAHSFSCTGSVANWLYTVAQRLAIKTQAQIANCHKKERRLHPMPRGEPLDEVTWQELRSVLDEEIGRLTEKYRAPIVLCFFEGKSHAQAARELGWPTNSLTRRLGRGRELLRRQLVRRGITLASGVLAEALCQKAVAVPVGPFLALSTVKGAASLAACKAAVGTGLSSSALALVEEGMNATMAFGMKSKLALVMLACTVAACGVGLAASGHWDDTIPHTVAPETPAVEMQKATAAAVRERQPPNTDIYGDPLPAGALARFGSVRWRHGEWITASALDPDQKRLVTASGRTVVVWDLTNAKILWKFETDFDSNYSRPSMSISPDGKRLGYVHNGMVAFVWDLDSGKEIKRFGKDLSTYFHSCQFTADGKAFILADSNQIWFFDLNTWAQTRSFSVKNAYFLDPNRAVYVAITPSREIVIGDLRTGAEMDRLEGAYSYRGNVNQAIAIAGGGSKRILAVVNSQKEEIQIWEFPKFKKLKSFRLPNSVFYPRDNAPEPAFDCHVSLSADGKELFLGTGRGSVHRWDLTTSKELPTLEKHAGFTFSTVSGIHRLQDGKTIVTAGADGVIRRWDAATGTELTDHSCYAAHACAALSPDGRMVAVADGGGRVDIWDAKTGNILRILRKNGPIVNKLAFAPDGRTIAVGFLTGDVVLLEVPSGRETKVLSWNTSKPRAGLEPHLKVLLFSPDGRFLYVNNYYYQGRVWNLLTADVAWVDKGRHTAAWTPDGLGILVHSVGPSVTLLDSKTGQERSSHSVAYQGGANLGGIVPAFAYSPDGRYLAMGLLNGMLLLCDGKTLKELKRVSILDPPRDPDDILGREIARRGGFSAECVAFSPDGQWLITSNGRWGSVRLWDASTLTEVVRMEGHEGRVTALAFSPSQKTALSSASDGQTYLWDLRPKADDKGRQPLEVSWANLASGDASLAYRAVWALSEQPGAAEFLATKISAVKAIDERTLTSLLDDLNSDNFRTREAATKALRELGDRAAGGLTEALKKSPPLEPAQRMRQLLDALDAESTPATMQQMRTIKSLELAGTDPARKLLQQWADGAPSARLTLKAKAALERLRDKP
jgi:RNA polymerase sigma factor (sigma-70 family)